MFQASFKLVNFVRAKCYGQWWALLLFKKAVNKYISGDWPLSTHADPTSTRHAIFHEWCISSVKFMSAHRYSAVNRTSLWLQST